MAVHQGGCNCGAVLESCQSWRWEHIVDTSNAAGAVKLQAKGEPISQVRTLPSALF